MKLKREQNPMTDKLMTDKQKDKSTKRLAQYGNLSKANEKSLPQGLKQWTGYSSSSRTAVIQVLQSALHPRKRPRLSVQNTQSAVAQVKKKFIVMFLVFFRV